MEAPAISIVILSCNRREELEPSLRQILPGAREQGWETIVVDNASTDGTREMLASLAATWPELRLVLNETNRGASGGRNDGFALARGRYVLSLDDDGRMTNEEIARLPGIFESLPQTGILTFPVRQPNGHYEVHHGPAVKDVANYHGAGPAFRKEVFDRVGVLDEVCTYGAEELDISIRAHAIGLATTFIPSITVEHHKLLHQGQRRAQRRSDLVRFYARVLFKHFPFSMAACFTWRYLLRFALPDLAHGRLLLVMRLCAGAWQGGRGGRKVHAPIPARSVAFYRDPTLRPDIGNTPLPVRFRELRASKLKQARAVAAGAA